MDSLWIMITVMLVLSAITAVLTFMYNSGKKSVEKKRAENEAGISKKQESIAVNGTDSVDSLSNGTF